MLAYSGFEIGHPLLECGVGRLNLGDLLLLEMDGEEAGADEGTHGGRRGGPIGVRNPCW